MDTIEPGRSFGLWMILARILNQPQLGIRQREWVGVTTGCRLRSR